MTTIEEISLGSPRLKHFVKFPWTLYRKDPNWTPVLNMDMLGNKLLNAKGILTPQHSYHEFAEVTHFLAWQNQKPVGRISAAVNHRYNKHHSTNIGFFGFFDVIEDFEVAKQLLDNAKEWVSSKGMTTLRGPGEYSNATYERQGCLIWGFEHPPVVEMTHNYPYYGEYLERYGFQKAMDYKAHILKLKQPMPESLQEMANKAKASKKFTTRAVDLKNLADEIRMIVDIYNDAWKANWGYLPITQGEADALADTLKPIIDPKLIRLAYCEGEPIAVFGAFPDPFYALKPQWKWYGDSDLVRIMRLLQQRRHITRTRLIFFGIRKPYRLQGIDALLYQEVNDYITTSHYESMDISLLLEVNRMIIQAAEHFNAKHYKTWRIYDLPLT